jgi:site-specific DNA-methyltransferase (cytosine-N4-specific)
MSIVPISRGSAARPASTKFPKLNIEPSYVTPLGRAYQADALDVLKQLPADSISLIVTSPPFALIRRKAYGNVDAKQYIEWFWPFVEEIHRVLRPDGSFVLEIGGAWNSGSPTRSLYQYELLIRMCQTFHLAQDFYWFNPSRLPTPAEWVTIKRTRVKDSVNPIFWLSKTPNPFADNRQVLKPYSKSMKRLLRDGYDTAMRPSQHEIGPHFGRDNGGAIPPNMLSIPNTRSNEVYLRRCREAGVAPHPARFPVEVPDFFVRFLTVEGQMVFDPFAGSNVTGAAAEALGRKWISTEIQKDYVDGSRYRFDEPAAKPRAA